MLLWKPTSLRCRFGLQNTLKFFGKVLKKPFFNKNLDMIMKQLVNIEENKQLYLQRVNQFYHLLKDWLAEKHFIFATAEHLFKDELGTYHGTQMTIEKKDKTLLAHLIPVGAKSLLGEGVIEIVNWPRAYFLYAKTGINNHYAVGRINPHFKRR